MGRRRQSSSASSGQNERLTPYTAYVTLMTALAWTLQAIPVMAPAFIDPTACGRNCSSNQFRTVPKYFNIAEHDAELTASIYFLGSLLLGQIPMLFADSLGRRPILLASTTVTALSTALCVLAPNYHVFLLGRLLQGACWTSACSVNWLLCSECLPFAWHARALIFFSLMWVTGYCLVAPLAILTMDWRSMFIISGSITAVYAAILYLTIRESLGFLIANGRHTEAREWNECAKRFNGLFTRGPEGVEERPSELPLVEKIEEPVETEDNAEAQSAWYLLKSALRDRDILLHLLIFIYMWMSDFVVYNGLSLTSTGIKVGDPITNYLISGLVELPGAILSPILMDLFGRRKTVRLTHLITAIACFTTIWITHEYEMLYLTMWMAAKLGTGASFFALYIYASEAFPIEYRSICMGTAGTLGNIGAIAAPFSTHLGLIQPWLHTVVYGLLSLVTVIIVRGLPETMH